MAISIDSRPGAGPAVLDPEIHRPDRDIEHRPRARRKPVRRAVRRPFWQPPVRPPRWSGRRVAHTSALAAHLLGLGAALITFGMMCWQLGRPAFWLDESASVIATQRSWPDLWLLLHGSDAPLVPFYVVLKLLTGLSTAVDPGLWHHPEVMYRWPSVVAVSAGMWVLTTWLARTQSLQLAFGTAFAALCTSGLSRYGQEARPYALVLLLAVVSTAIWAKLVSEGSGRLRPWLWTAAYGVSIALMTMLHTLSASLLAAHLLASLVAPAQGRRWRTFARTLLGGGLGLLAVLKVVLLATHNGAGATAWPSLTWPHLWAAWLDLFTLAEHPWLRVGPVLILAVIGMTRAFGRRYEFIARLALCWAAVPPLLLLPAVFLRHNLLLGRYLLFSVPAWAILAGLGVATIAEKLRRLVSTGLRRGGVDASREWSARVPLPGVRSLMHTGLTGRKGVVLDRMIDALARLLRRRTLTLRARTGWVAWLAAGAVTAGVLVVTASGQASSLSEVRGPAGHDGKDIRPALDAANWPQYAGLPIVSSSNLQVIAVAAYDRLDDDRLAGITIQRSGANVWAHSDAQLRKEVLSASPRVVYLQFGTAGNLTFPNCEPAASILPATAFAPVSLLTRAAMTERCMLPILQRMHYRVVALAPSGPGWQFAVLDRTPPAAPAPASVPTITASVARRPVHTHRLDPTSRLAETRRKTRPGAQ